MTDYLKGFSSLSDSTVTNDIRNNLVSFLDYGLLQKDNFINVERPQSGVYGGIESRLRPVRDPRFTFGQVWQGFRSNWVWESGVSALVSSDNSHPGVSGVYVNNAFYPTSTTGNYAHYIDHINGRVIFNSAIPSTGVVECNYSYKYINVKETDSPNWFQEIQQRSYRSDSTSFISQSGEYSDLAENRYQLPAIGIELANSRGLRPYQLGGGQYVYTDFFFHCIAEDSYTRDKMIDILTLQNEKTILTFNLNDISSADKFPIDYRGVPTSGAMTYPELVSNYPGSYLRLFNFRLDSTFQLGSIYVGTIKCTTEIALGV